MVGEFITWSLVLVLGYAYPAFRCFKTIEKNRVEIPELRFWCQYWIIVAVLTCLEKVGDVFVSWLPMYGEMKLALFIYLWYPKTRGTEYVYDTLLRPYVSKHELDIDRNLVGFRDKAWDLAIYYWHNCTELGSEKIIQILQFLASRNSQNNSQNGQSQPPPSAPPASGSGFFRRSSSSSIQRSETPKPETVNGHVDTQTHFIRPPKTETIKVHLDKQTHYVRPEDVIRVPGSDKGNGVDPNTGVEQDVQAARLRLRRFIGGK